MEFSLHNPQAGPFDDLIGRTLPLTINDVSAGEVLIKSVDGDGTMTFEIDGDTPAARMITRGELREGAVSLGTVGRRYPYSGWLAKERPRLDFSMRVEPAEH